MGLQNTQSMHGAGTGGHGDLTLMVNRIEQGCRQAEGELYTALSRDVAREARRLSNTPYDAEDLGADIWEVLLRKLRAGQVRDGGALHAFVRGVARRLAANRRRRLDNQLVLSTEQVEAQVSVNSPSPDRLTESAESLRLVREAIAGLSVERDREVLTAVLFREFTTDEMARVFRLKHAHVPRVVSRAKGRLRSSLGSVMQDGAASELGPVRPAGQGLSKICRSDSMTASMEDV